MARRAFLHGCLPDLLFFERGSVSQKGPWYYLVEVVYPFLFPTPVVGIGRPNKVRTSDTPSPTPPDSSKRLFLAGQEVGSESFCGLNL
jgi:hypothetical protein